MKISTSKSELLNTLQKLSKAVPARSTLPILSCALFRVENDTVFLRTTDLEITLVSRLTASIEEPGTVAIPLQTLLEITGALPDGRLTIASNPQNKVEIFTDTGVYDLMGKPAEEFPALPEVQDQRPIQVSGDVLQSIIHMTLFAVSRDELKPALTGVFFKFEPDRLTAVSTDGHRLVQYIVRDYEDGEFSGEMIVPRKFLSLMNTLLNASDELDLSLSENHLTAVVGDDSVYTRVIDERFPDYESVIPRDNDKKLVVNRDEFLGSVRRVSIFSNKSTQQIALRLNSERSLITTEDPEKASRAQEELKAEYEGEDLVIGYNALYLKDIVSHINDEKVVAQFKTPISAALFYPQNPTENRDVTMLLMPIRLND
ncbi:MAG: DNA polymerase III subunit beta [Candidatus Neomarinimicrobiota bacterium]|nr:MAG: DNA polymerase III subunit beta [Candidatus Neomarinimicrobiota bacterium]